MKLCYKLISDLANQAGIVITDQPLSQIATLGSHISISVTIISSAVTCQWYLNGIAISGANELNYNIPAMTYLDAGSYTAILTSNTGSQITQAAQLSVLSPGRIVNFSVLSNISPDNQVFSVGFVSGGLETQGTQALLIRAVGPTLGRVPFNLPNVLLDPALSVFNSSKTPIASNDDWGSSAINFDAVLAANVSTGAFPLISATSLDSALVVNLKQGAYTVQISGKNENTGNVLAEVYDMTPSGMYQISFPRLVNVSSLVQVLTGGTLTAGFVISGSTLETVLIRVSGPTLAMPPFNLIGTLIDPKLTLFDSTSKVLATDTGWAGNITLSQAAKQVGAFPFISTASSDSAVLMILKSGAYTVQITSRTGVKGVVLIEIYEVSM